ncbi:hypothetical protein R1flu_017179 [Riccia fluitans]|uniref:Uncharacterized protein n=1 Tax=Riccia fluitans TaxID=41844 RepID=A0ABD1XEB2_9MARC
MIEHGLTKGGQDLQQNVGKNELFVGASKAFREAQCTALKAVQERPRASQEVRNPLNDISNWPATQLVKSASTSPLAKRSRPLNFDMELLAQQIATQVVNSKAANASKGTSGQQSRMGTDDPRNKDSGHSQFGSQEPEQGQLPKVLFKASSNGVMKDKVPITESPNNRKPPTYASKVALSEQGPARPFEPRMRAADAWKAARERRNNTLKVAATSEDCIRRNRDCFQRLEKGRLEENPYPELEQQVIMTEERQEEICETYKFLRQTHAQTQGKVVRAFIDTQQLSSRINFLKEKTFVLYTVDISPSRDVIL